MAARAVRQPRELDRLMAAGPDLLNPGSSPQTRRLAAAVKRERQDTGVRADRIACRTDGVRERCVRVAVDASGRNRPRRYGRRRWRVKIIDARPPGVESARS